MAIALVSHVGRSNAGNNGGTSTAINTTGATLLVFHVARFGGNTTSSAPSDSAGNTWTALTVHTEGTGGSGTYSKIWYVLNPTTNASHTFTYTSTGAGCIFQVSAFSGVAGFDVEGGAINVGGNSVQIGASFPSYNNSLILSCIADISSSHSIDSSFTITDSAASAGGNYGGGMAYLIQSGTTSSINPTWTISNGANTSAGGFAIFFPAVTNANVVATASVAGVSNGTTAAVVTTGAKIIVINLSSTDIAGHFPTISDSKSNTWTALAQHHYATDNVINTLYYSINPTVGSGHTFSFTAATGTNSSSIQVAAFDIPSLLFDVQNGATGGSTSLAPGSVTPSVNNALIVAGCSLDGAPGPAVIDSGFVVLSVTQYVAGTNYGGTLAYFVQTSAAPVNPTWTLPFAGGATGIAVFDTGGTPPAGNTRSNFFFAA